MRIIINQIPEGFTRLVLSSCYKWRRQCRGCDSQRYRVFQKTFNQTLAYWQPSEDHTFRSSPFSARQCWWRSPPSPFLNRHARLYNKPILFLSLFLAFVRISSPSHHRAYFVLTPSFFIYIYIHTDSDDHLRLTFFGIPGTRRINKQSFTSANFDNCKLIADLVQELMPSYKANTRARYSLQRSCKSFRVECLQLPHIANRILEGTNRETV